MSTFSQKMQELLSSSKSLTLKDLISYFQEKSFAILFLLLMATPALPLPTGGVTHVFEIIVGLLAIELVFGKKTVWLPARWINVQIPNKLRTSALPKFIKILKWFEKISKQRLSAVLNNSVALRIIGLVVLLFTTFAFLAPPFSGLDTLPSLGVVIISLALVFEDLFLFIVGLVLGSVGITIILLLGRAVFKLL